ncbi:alpha/beta hydrolase family protein [Planctomonas deserti]|uniref:alpha/beta hydrolase family protein n=1 Tax=Planctomonas deserti TaxID=2144185 RepID=UPI001F0C11C2|nr:alpha/beta fold hydrolase [Planctomonas deserti]
MARRRPLLPALRAAAVAGAAVAGAALVTAGMATSFARGVVKPERRRTEGIRILGVNDAGDRVMLSASPDALLPGDYSLWFWQGAGHARVGEITARTGTMVTRVVLGTDFGDLRRARTGRFNGWVYLNPRELGVPHENVTVPMPVGAAPAWLIPAEGGSDRWALHVHGRGTRRPETLRGVPVFRDAGFTSLIVSYRNDEEAPPSEDGRYALGDTEWEDLEAAIRFAVDRGAREIVLVGWSMGGAVVLQTVLRSPLASFVRGIVLDSPVIDWVETLNFQGDARGLPRRVERGAFGILAAPWGRALTGLHAPIDFARLNVLERAQELRIPMLLLHSDDDGFVPSAGSRHLAAARPDLVTLVPFDIARHAKLWNYDRDRWNGAISGWLGALGLTD